MFVLFDKMPKYTDYIDDGFPARPYCPFSASIFENVDILTRPWVLPSSSEVRRATVPRFGTGRCPTDHSIDDAYKVESTRYHDRMSLCETVSTRSQVRYRRRCSTWHCSWIAGLVAVYSFTEKKSYSVEVDEKTLSSASLCRSSHSMTGERQSCRAAVTTRPRSLGRASVPDTPPRRYMLPAWLSQTVYSNLFPRHPGERSSAATKAYSRRRWATSAHLSGRRHQTVAKGGACQARSCQHDQYRI